MVLDIKRFGALNEALGVQVADAVLGMIANRLRRELRTGDAGTPGRRRVRGRAQVRRLVRNRRPSCAAGRRAAGRCSGRTAENRRLGAAPGLGIGITLFPKYENDGAGEVLRRAQTSTSPRRRSETGGQSIVFFDERMGERRRASLPARTGTASCDQCRRAACTCSRRSIKTAASRRRGAAALAAPAARAGAAGRVHPDRRVHGADRAARPLGARRGRRAACPQRRLPAGTDAVRSTSARACSQAPASSTNCARCSLRTRTAPGGWSSS